MKYQIKCTNKEEVKYAKYHDSLGIVFYDDPENTFSQYRKKESAQFTARNILKNHKQFTDVKIITI